MSFWGTIAKIAGVGAAPFTGGLSLIPVAAGVAGDLIGAKLQSNAQNKASDRQAQATREALDFEKGVYQNDINDFAGLRGLGDDARVRLGDLLSQSRQPATANGIFNGGAMTLNQMRSAGGGQPPAAGGGMVRMVSPDGEARMVRPEAVAKYEQRGARRV